MPLIQTQTRGHQRHQVLALHETMDRVVPLSDQAVADQTVDRVRVLKGVAHKLADQASQVAAQNERVDVVHNSVDGLTKPLP